MFLKEKREHFPLNDRFLVKSNFYIHPRGSTSYHRVTLMIKACKVLANIIWKFLETLTVLLN